MRPLYHPTVEAITVEGILYALADPVRVKILMEIVNADCAQNCSQFLNVDNKKLPKSTLSQHFKVLREAGLIRSERKGVELHNTSRCKEIKKRFGSMIEEILAAYEKQSGSKKKTFAAK
jgi:DNA-binding transcriptional ArsR family regulator